MFDKFPTFKMCLFSLAVCGVMATSLLPAASAETSAATVFSSKTFDISRNIAVAPFERTPNVNNYFSGRLASPSTVSYATYFGGSNSEAISAVRADAFGNVYVAGRVQSANFPLLNARDAELGGLTDAFAAKFNPAGQLVWSTYLGGAGIDSADDLALDAAGNVYVVGNTQSADFPVTANAFDQTINSVSDAFVTKISSDGSTLLYSTFFGGAQSGFGNIGDEAARAVAVDSSGSVFIAGYTTSLDLPTRRAFDTGYGKTGNNIFNYSDAFVAKLDTARSGSDSLVYSTYLGTDAGDQSYDLAIDAFGQAYVVGATGAGDFPYLNQVPSLAPEGANGTFLVKFPSDGGAPLYSTPVGGRNYVVASALAVNRSGEVFVAGGIGAAGFPITPGAFDTTYNGNNDGFLTKINSNGTQVMFSTVIGAGDYDTVHEIAVNDRGDVAVVGITSSSDFPLFNPADATRGGQQIADPYSALRYDATVTVFEANGAALRFSTFLGGDRTDGAGGIASDAAGNFYAVGATTSLDFPVINAFDPTFGGTDSGGDSFLVKYAGVSSPTWKKFRKR